MDPVWDPCHVSSLLVSGLPSGRGFTLSQTDCTSVLGACRYTELIQVSVCILDSTRIATWHFFFWPVSQCLWDFRVPLDLDIGMRGINVARLAGKEQGTLPFKGLTSHLKEFYISVAFILVI